MNKGLLTRIVREKLWRFGYRRGFCSRKLTTDDLDNQGVRLQKLRKNWDEDPNIGFMVVEGSLSMSTDPSYEQGRPCKFVVELGHIIDRGRRVTQLESSSYVLRG